MFDHAACPGDPIAEITPDAALSVDSFVDALLDAVDPNVLTMSGRVVYLRDRPEPVIIARLNAAQWELSVTSWSRAAADICIRSRGRPLNLPSLAGPMQTFLDGGLAAMRRAAMFDVRGAH